MLVCLNWSNIRFESDSSSFEITFEMRKNAEFRQGSKVHVATTKAEVCPLKLLRLLQSRCVDSIEDHFIFRGLNSCLVAKNPAKTSPMLSAIKYGKYMRYLSLWFGGVLGLSPKEFKNQYESQSDRIGCASSASNAGIPVEL